MSKVQDDIAREIWQCYVVEVGRALPEGLADKMAESVVRGLGLTQFYSVDYGWDTIWAGNNRFRAVGAFVTALGGRQGRPLQLTWRS